MHSMTGYGLGQSELEAGRLVVELRAVNHRFVDVRVRLPAPFADRSFALEQRCRERFSRGRYEVNVWLDGIDMNLHAFDTARARTAYQGLCQLRDEIAPGCEVPLEMLASIPGCLTTLSVPRDLERAMDQALDLAWASLTEMRRAEGERLARDIAKKLASAQDLRAQIAESAAPLANELFAKARERVTRLLTHVQSGVDAGRLAQELALWADKTDIDEELVRLQSHLDYFVQLLAESGPLGRKLDFLLQEIAREANTIGAKCQHAHLAHLVVELKGIVERIREQVQNVE